MARHKIHQDILRI